MTCIREGMVNECKQKWKLKTYQVSRHFTIDTSCCQRFMVDTLKFRWRFNIRGVLPIAYINQTYTRHSAYYFAVTGGLILIRFLRYVWCLFRYWLPLCCSPQCPVILRQVAISTGELWTVGWCEEEQPLWCNIHRVGPTISSDFIYHCLWWVYWLIIIWLVYFIDLHGWFDWLSYWCNYIC